LTNSAFTYRNAGVDLRTSAAIKARLRALVEGTRTAGVRSGFGSFAGRFETDGGPQLVASADGVGTKLLVAVRAGRHDTVGEDLVNHCVNDILAEGARPLFFLDYFATGRFEPEVAVSVVEGVARGCRANDCALLGGETAEMPGVYRAGEYDLAGFIVGRLAYPELAERALEPGDRLLGLASNGLHTNGYSLVRALVFDRLALDPLDSWPGSDRSVADVLLRVHRSYLGALGAACEARAVRALAHITGGGIPGNLSRVLPSDADAVVDLGSWKPAAEFRWIAEISEAPQADLYRTLNMGVGMIAVVRPERLEEVRASVIAAGCSAFPCGKIVAGNGQVHLEGAPG